MTELLRTNDLVLISAVEAILRAAYIDCHVADRHMSAVEGSIGALPRRLLIATDDAARARKILQEAGYGHALAAP
jgi:Putative prokaryotic signal transducing protein